jgi:hypothetical protein
MKKLFLCIFLSLFINSSVNADWTIASEHVNGVSEFYIDKDNIRKDGSTRYFWLLMNLKDRKADRKHNSAIVYVQLDCKLLRGKDLKFISKSLEMGKGEQVSEFTPPDEWNYPPPGSNMEKTYKAVCNL